MGRPRHTPAHLHTNTNFTETEGARGRETERKREMKVHLDEREFERIVLVVFWVESAFFNDRSVNIHIQID